MNKIGAVILTGGKSSRMGENKANLTLDGQTFLSKIIGQLDDFDEILLSVDNADKYAAYGLEVAEDLHPNIGPVGGIYSALKSCRSDYLLAVSCDMPLFRRELAQYICSFVYGAYDAFVLVGRDGRKQPLCAVYSVKAANILENQIAAEQYRMMDALEKMHVRYISMEHSIFSDDLLRNINTPADYARLVKQKSPAPIIAVCGIKKSGKTTLLANIIPILKKRGLRVAAIKHDGHDFNPDMPGTDSYRLRMAGAYGVGIYSAHRYMVTAEKSGVLPDFFVTFFPDADIILLEGGKHSCYPKIEVVRGGVSDGPASDKSNLIALCSDLNLNAPGVPVFSLDDYFSIANAIIQYIGKGEIYV